MTDVQVFNNIKRFVQNNGECIKGNTIGGRWTVETWKFRDIVVQIMDEGYTSRILIQNTLDVIESYDNKISFNVGNSETMKRVLGNITIQY